MVKRDKNHRSDIREIAQLVQGFTQVYVLSDSIKWKDQQNSEIRKEKFRK